MKLNAQRVLAFAISVMALFSLALPNFAVVAGSDMRDPIISSPNDRQNVQIDSSVVVKVNNPYKDSMEIVYKWLNGSPNPSNDNEPGSDAWRMYFLYNADSYDYFSYTPGEKWAGKWVKIIAHNKVSGRWSNPVYVYVRPLTNATPAVTASVAHINDDRLTNSSKAISVYDRWEPNGRTKVGTIETNTLVNARDKFTLSNGEVLCNIWTYHGEKAGYVFASDLRKPPQISATFNRDDITSVYVLNDSPAVPVLGSKGHNFIAFKDSKGYGMVFSYGPVTAGLDSLIATPARMSVGLIANISKAMEKNNFQLAEKIIRYKVSFDPNNRPVYEFYGSEEYNKDFVQNFDRWLEFRTSNANGKAMLLTAESYLKEHPLYGVLTPGKRIGQCDDMTSQVLAVGGLGYQVLNWPNLSFENIAKTKADAIVGKKGIELGSPTPMPNSPPVPNTGSIGAQWVPEVSIDLTSPSFNDEPIDLTGRLPSFNDGPIDLTGGLPEVIVEDIIDLTHLH